MTRLKLLLLQGLLGQVTMDPNKSLLEVLDSHAAEFGLTYNGNVIRKALRSLVFEDVKLSQYDQMVHQTLTTLRERFEAGEENASETADDFFSLTMSHVLHKLAKQILNKRVKEIQRLILFFTNRFKI